MNKSVKCTSFKFAQQFSFEKFRTKSIEGIINYKNEIFFKLK